MALQLKGVFVWFLLVIILMEEAKPVLAKRQKLKKRVKELTKLEDRMKAMEEFDVISDCPPGEKTDNPQGRCCVFPFVYRGVSYDSCTKVRHDRLWCSLTATYSGEWANCELADCGDPGVSEHGSKIGENYLEGGTVTFTCDAGYHLEGSANLVCLENGNWNNALPKCSKLPSAVAGLEDSKILNNDTSFLKALGDYLEPVTHSNSQWQRCWRASVDGWGAAKFHSLCDDKGPTVTIVRVDHKYIFGGYTSLSWGRSCGYHYDSTAFLFSLVNKPGWQPVKLDQTGVESYHRAHSIYTCSPHGPTFGGGHDLHIADQASSNTQSYSNLGWVYSPPTGYSYGSDFAQSFLAGTYRFQPDEVEVFYERT